MHKKFLFFALSLTFLFIIFCLNSVSATDVYECRFIDESGIYELNQSIEISAGVSQLCILINVSNVTLDCINYSNSIVGNGSNDTIGVAAFDNIASQTLTNITVKNCNITKFDKGVWFNNTNNSLIFNNSAYNTTGIDLEYTLNINISKNKITTFDSNSSAILLMNDNSSLVEYNTISTQAELGYGITVVSTNDARFISNTITTSGLNATGITLDEGSTNISITGSNITTFNNDAFGIMVFMGSNSNVLFNNTVTTSGADAKGIFLDEVNDTNFTSNIVTTSGADAEGLNLMNSNNTVATKNTIKTGDSSACTILVDGAENNAFYDNIFNNSNETVPGFCSGTPSLANNWNTTKEVATNIMGGPNLGGNFWTNNVSTGYSDTCIDSDGDYICDTAYNLAGLGSEDTNNIDYLPLANHTNMISTCATLDVENKSYFLNQNITGITGTCFNITANNITLNFMGFNITGNTTGYGINISSYNYSIIMNGSIINFSNGIYFLSSSSNLLTDFNISDSKQDAIVLTNAESGNNNFTNVNVINTNLSCYDIKFATAGINGTWIININFANYTFTGAGGKVNFKEPNFGEIVFLEPINGSGHSLRTDVDIESNSIFVDSSNNVGLNKSANISLYSITYTDPEPQYSSDATIWVTCTSTTDPACSELSFSGNIFTFNTTHFTYFKAIEVYSAPEEDNGDTGGGGGGLGLPPSEEDEEEGYEEGDSFEGEAGGIPYNGTIDEITNDTVTITIGNQTFTLEIGETIEVDLDFDGLFDLKITLLGIEEGKADLRFEDIPKPGEEPEVEKTFWQKLFSYPFLLYIIIGLIVLAIILVIIALLSRKKGHH